MHLSHRTAPVSKRLKEWSHGATASCWALPFRWISSSMKRPVVTLRAGISRRSWASNAGTYLYRRPGRWELLRVCHRLAECWNWGPICREVHMMFCLDFDVVAAQVVFMLSGSELIWYVGYSPRWWWSCVGKELSNFVHGGALSNFELADCQISCI